MDSGLLQLADMKRAPVLLIGFNRPENMGEVLAQIRKAKPEVLYVAVDGPRKNKAGEAKKCQQCRDLVQTVDWECELHTLFREENVGCALGVSGAISWAFENEDRLIILEDDCVPQDSFFSFCDEMLELYKDDSRVWQICGRSYHPNTLFFKHSDYVFSHYAHIWGWATWKRCWEFFDLRMTDFPQFIKQGGADNVYQSKLLARRSNRFFKRIYSNIDVISTHTWDYQWSYTKLKNGALGIIPRVNLIRNIGTTSGAHADGEYADNLQTGDMPVELRHPSFVIDDAGYDYFHYTHHIHVPFIKKCFNRGRMWVNKVL